MNSGFLELEILEEAYNVLMVRSHEIIGLEDKINVIDGMQKILDLMLNHPDYMKWVQSRVETDEN